MSDQSSDFVVGAGIVSTEHKAEEADDTNSLEITKTELSKIEPVGLPEVKPEEASGEHGKQNDDAKLDEPKAVEKDDDEEAISQVKPLVAEDKELLGGDDNDVESGNGKVLDKELVGGDDNDVESGNGKVLNQTAETADATVGVEEAVDSGIEDVDLELQDISDVEDENN